MAYRGLTQLTRGLWQPTRRLVLQLPTSRAPQASRRHYIDRTKSKKNVPMSEQMTINSIRTNRTWKNKKASLVIFDKDGTLVDFHSMWYPWMQKLCERLSADSGISDLEEKVYDLVGYCTEKQKFNPGLLAEGTKSMLMSELSILLENEGLSQERAEKIVEDNWEEGHTCESETQMLKEIACTRTLFKILKSHDVKIAISTSDSREGTIETMKELGLEKYVDLVVCGDDPDIKPKPNPYSAFKICSKLGIEPGNTVMVGDTKADVGMGAAAKLGWNVGVLSGVGNSEDLLPEADHVIRSVKDLLPLILPGTEWKQYYKYGTSERIMVAPHHLEEGHEVGVSSDTKLRTRTDVVIFDLHGTLLDSHIKYSEWVDVICQRMEQITGLTLASEVHERLGYCDETRTLMHGVLSESTNKQVKSVLVKFLMEKGLGYEESVLMVNQTWEECSHLLERNSHLIDDNTEALFLALKQHGVKIAVNTSAARESALMDLDSLGLLNYVDMMVCGDDPHSEPKPSAHNAQIICKEFKADPDHTVMIGDTPEDIIMATGAKIRNTIGVLSGIGNPVDLERHAEAVVPKIGSLMTYFFEQMSKANPDEPIKASSRSYSTLSSSQNHSKSFSTLASHQSSRSYNTLASVNGCAKVASQLRRHFSTSSNRSSAEKSSYDYIVVGGGSAGCVISNRLSESGKDKVVVLEAGPTDFSWKIWMPAALMYNLCDDNYNWFYHTEPEPHMNNRVMYWPRGRVLGGSSALNAMVYIRGHAQDYDRWETEGATGWSYASCLPYFRKAQNHELGEDDYRGGSGPLHVSRGKTNHPLHHAFIEAGQQAGYPFTDDMNGYQQEGVGWMDMTIHKGKRWSAAEAYLHPAKSRPNLDVKTKVLTTRVLFDGDRAVGVEYEEKGQKKQVLANKEVVLCGGSINSPQLLMLSGVGDGDALRGLDIPVVAHLPGVGQNLQDHLEMYVQYKCKQPITLYSAQWKFPHNMVRIGAQWFLTQTGWGATAHLESGGFIRSRAGTDLEHPDLQIHFLPSVVNDHGRKNGDCHAYQMHMGSLRAKSKGHLTLKSRDPREHPRIVANYLKEESDMRELIDSIDLARDIFSQKAFDEFNDGELQPGPDCKTESQMKEFIRNVADSAYHPSCTCKMGQGDDPMSVVGPDTKIHGLEGIRVVDASIMPSIVSGNLNGPTIMVAEKAADIIRGVQPLPKSTAPVYKPKTLEKQR